MPSGNLQIVNASREDEGTYKCAAYNPVTQEVKTSGSSDRLRVRRKGRGLPGAGRGLGCHSPFPSSVFKLCALHGMGAPHPAGALSFHSPLPLGLAHWAAVLLSHSLEL